MFQHMERRAEKHGGSYAEARRQEAIRAAEKAGRQYTVRGPRKEYERQCAARRAERESPISVAELRATKLRVQSFRRDMVAAERRFHLEPSQVEESRQKRNARFRRCYSQDPGAEVARTSEYKMRHSKRMEEWNRTRYERVKQQSVGDATPEAIERLKAEADCCAYCGASFSSSRDRQTDHMVALCHGGEHSLRNIVIACASCNLRKAKLSYHEWVNRIAIEHRARVVRLWAERYERTWEQAA